SATSKSSGTVRPEKNFPRASRNPPLAHLSKWEGRRVPPGAGAGPKTTKPQRNFAGASASLSVTTSLVNPDDKSRRRRRTGLSWRAGRSGGADVHIIQGDRGRGGAARPAPAGRLSLPAGAGAEPRRRRGPDPGDADPRLPLPARQHAGEA